jgi:hypothetical protein
MDMWTIFAIALAAMVVALVLAYLLKSRLSDDDVWQELVDPDAPTEESPSHFRSLTDEVTFVRAEEFLRPGVQPMRSSNSSPSASDVDLRRSSRVENPVSLVVLGTNRRGESFQERTSAVSFNLHGCRYSSRHECQPETWVTLQVTGTDGAAAPPARARVRSILSPQTPRELCQVGVELETPANIWGLSSPPEDWQRVLGPAGSGARAATATAPALAPAGPSSAFAEHPPEPADRRAEVTVFPSPAGPEPPKEPAGGKSERVTFTPEQLLQALQGKLQLAAERAVDTALSERLDETVKQALGKIEEGWKANLRQTEEFSAARLAEVQSRWERELVVYRSRAEEISRRVEALASSSRQGLIELQKFAERIKNEIEPQFNSGLQESFTRAKSDLENSAEQLTERTRAKITEYAQFSAQQARAQLDETVAEARALLTAAKAPSTAGVAEERLESLINSSREAMLTRSEERLSDIWSQFEQQQDLARHRTDEIAQHVEMLATQLSEAKAQQEKALADVRAMATTAGDNSSEQRLAGLLKQAKEQILSHVEWRLGEVSGRADQLHHTAEQRAEEIARRIEGLAADSTATRAQLEQSTGEFKTLLANTNGGFSQQHLDSVLNSVREQLLNHLEWRMGEISGQFQQRHDNAGRQSAELAERLDAFAAELRGKLEEQQAKTENLLHELRPQDLAAVEQSVDRAAREFEVSAARISDRQLVRLMQQKQALSTEASLESEARASETRALLQKTANSMLEEFGKRVEAQNELIITEATERVASSLASLDAESRAACEARRRDVERQVAHAAEQSTAEFRAGIKAFLYSCLVAAVSAVDEHAQSTLASLEKDPSMPPAIEGSREPNSPSSNGVPQQRNNEPRG